MGKGKREMGRGTDALQREQLRDTRHSVLALVILLPGLGPVLVHPYRIWQQN